MALGQESAMVPAIVPSVLKWMFLVHAPGTHVHGALSRRNKGVGWLHLLSLEK